MKSLFDKILNSKYWLPAIIVLVVGFNWLGATFHSRIDFTDEKRFTLSPSTITVLEQLDSTVDVTVLLAGDIKSEFKKLSNSTRELLSNFKNYAGNRIQYQFEIPGEGLEDSVKAMVYDSLVNMGLRPTTQLVQAKEGEGKIQRQVFPGAIITYRGRSIAVDLLQGQVQKSVFNSDDVLDKQSLNSAEALLEYKFANAIQKLTEKKVPVVAYAYGNGEPEYGFPFVNDVFEMLGKNFIVDTVNVRTTPFISNEYAALVIVKPLERFTDDDKFKLDQYVMRGGRLFFFIDALYAEKDSLQNQSGDMIAYSRDLNITDLIFRYGARINNDLIADRYCDKIPIEVGSVGGQSQKQLLPWIYSPLLQPGSDHPIVKNQADVLSQFANSVDTIEVEGVRKTILLSSSANAYKTPTPARIALNSLQTEEDIAKFNQSHIPVAVLLEGTFSSLYANRATQSQLDTLKEYGLPFLRSSEKEGKVIVVGDADMVINPVSEVVGPLPMGVNKYTKIQYANREFFVTGVEYLANDKNILAAKAKDYTLRILDARKIETERSLWQTINIALPILLVVLFAIIYQYFRKRKFTRA